MRKAINKNGLFVHVYDAIEGEDYFCPQCNAKMVLKRGDVRDHHFAHPNNSPCSDTWHYDMTGWHREWQDRFPKECQEIVVSANGRSHRADVLIENNKVVFEFQHSPMTSSEFEERNDFYNSLGYKVVWIFDVEDQYENDKLETIKTNTWKWKYAFHTFDFFDYSNPRVSLFLQFDNINPALVKVTWCTEDKGMSYFKVDGKDYSDYSVITSYAEDIALAKRTIPLSALYDELMYLYSQDHTEYYFGCPISTTHMCANSPIDIPEKEYPKIMPCMVCQFYSDNYEMICRKRFLDLKIEQDAMVTIEERDENGFISSISFAQNDESINKIDLPTFKQNISKDVYSLWREKNCSIATFRNVNTGKYIRIKNDPVEQFNRTGKVYGYLSDDKFHFGGLQIELYNLEKKIWIMEWHK